MKKFLLIFLLSSLPIVAMQAQVGDAFKGIWPVTDYVQMKSLNGEWRLKVTKGVSAEKSVPEADHTWGTIPLTSSMRHPNF